MSEETTIVLNPGGTAETTVCAKDIQIKDLWHTAMAIREGGCQFWNKKDREMISQDILDVWTLAHNLKNHILEKEQE